MNKDYRIQSVKTSKDAIKHPKLSEKGVIPCLCSSTILVGKSGSGKSVLLHNLMTRKEFFHGHFDKDFLISPTGEADDVQKALNIRPNCVFTDTQEGISALGKIEKHQEEEIKKKGSGGAQKFAIIFDDVVVRLFPSFSTSHQIFFGTCEANEQPRVYWRIYQGRSTHHTHNFTYTSHTSGAAL